MSKTKAAAKKKPEEDYFSTLADQSGSDNDESENENQNSKFFILNNKKFKSNLEISIFFFLSIKTTMMKQLKRNQSK